MQIFEALEFSGKRTEPLVLTIGNFDGVHLGHRALLLEVVRAAERLGAIPSAMTFVPHPLKVILKNPEIKLLTTPEDRASLIESIGIERLFRLKFDEETARTGARDFVINVLHRNLQIAALVVGHDYTLGRNKEGNLQFLQNMGQELGFDVMEGPRQEVDGVVVSSTKIRECLLNGDILLANRLLGRPYSISGMVDKCSGRGHGLGFPTANSIDIKTLLPQNGVYITESCIDGRMFRSVTNIGHHPTFFTGKSSVETHLIDERLDVYGKSITTFFIKRIRAEHRYESREQLIRQICSDVDTARRFFHALERECPEDEREIPESDVEVGTYWDRTGKRS
ncbi:MAG: bifunctional riboflavin kinase/FAD synthetase [Candidatus Coatesbacteria bacterium]|nr:bifunctional riboflavin kinase/FAD synthetase [Candidatus Coatesbacteria bacterium]